MSHANTMVVQAAGLTKIFRDFWLRARVVAVDNLDFEIHQHEVFGLLGPNGSGKTTTIKMMLGLLYPTRGRLAVLGRPPTDVSIKSRIGYLPEESYLYRFLNARETLDYYGQLFQIPRQDRRRRVEQLLEMVGLIRDARRRVGEYSKGMARRIGLAQALINDPELLILDEPTSGLDPIGTREIKDLIVFLNREKRKTILLCSHLLADVEDVCRRVTILYGGRRQAVGDIRELLSQEDLTQITTERLSEGAIHRIRDLVERDENKQVLSVTTPTTKLETFFLKIVRQAQESRPHSPGTVISGRIAGFLGGPESTEGASLVDSLVAAASKPAEQAVEPIATAPDERPASEVIEGLLSTGPQSSTQEEPPPPTLSAEKEEGPNQELIDSLLKPANQPPRRHQE